MYTIHGHTCIKLSSFIKVLGKSKKESRDNKKNKHLTIMGTSFSSTEEMFKFFFNKDDGGGGSGSSSI